MSRVLSLVASLAVIACGGDRAADPHLVTSEPAYGPLSGGTPVVLRGTDLGPGPVRVWIGGREAPFALAIDTDTVGALIPPGTAVGDAEVVIATDRGTDAATGVFRYSSPPSISSLGPDRLIADLGGSITLVGSGFLAEDAGRPYVLVDGAVATNVRVGSDDTLTFDAPPGRALLRPEIEIRNARGAVKLAGHSSFRYVPTTGRGLLLFMANSTELARFFDPTTGVMIPIPRVSPPAVSHNSAIVGTDGEFWLFDRSFGFGKLDPRTHQYVQRIPLPNSMYFPAALRVGDRVYVIERNSQRFGTLDLETQLFTPIGPPVPCCGSYGLAYDGTTMYLAAREVGAIGLRIIYPETGMTGPPLMLPSQHHIEDMRFLDGELYAITRNGAILRIDPATGAIAVLTLQAGRARAMEVLE